jgi:hypothetical protein
MARNNKNRTTQVSAPDQQPTNSSIEPTETTSAFSFPLPTEVVDLPSEGKYYKEGSTLFGRSQIEIKYMTAKEEDILTSTSLAKKGLTLDRLLKSIIMDKAINTSELLVGDRNALILAARITGYGPEYGADIRCTECGNHYEAEIDLNNIGHKDVQDPSGVSVRDGIGYLTLPVANIEVGVKPITVQDEQRAEQISSKRQKHGLESTILTDLLRTIIVSAAGVEDRTEVSNLIDVLPARDSRAIRSAYKKIVPDVDFSCEVTCPSCGKEEVREVPIDAGFFWPDE